MQKICPLTQLQQWGTRMQVCLQLKCQKSMTLVLYYDSLRHYMCQKRSRFKSIDSHVSGPVGDQVKSLKGYHTHRFRTMQMHQTQAKSLTALRPSRTHLRNFVHTSGADFCSTLNERQQPRHWTLVMSQLAFFKASHCICSQISQSRSSWIVWADQECKQ